MAWPIIGRSFSPAEFEAYVSGLTWTDAFRPDGIVLHNTASPCLANRPDGLTRQHIANLEGYYKNTCKWNGGPHLFIDDKVIWVFNDLTKRGTHSPSWNASKLGIEMLGDFDKESFTDGRGLAVRRNAVAAMAILSNKLGFAADGFKFHIEDKRSDHACPGTKARAERAALVAEIDTAMAGTPVAVAEADDDESHIDTKAVDLAHAEQSSAEPETVPAQPIKAGMLSERNFAKLNELADQSSRVATHLRNFKAAIWKRTGTAVGTGVTLASTVNTEKGLGAMVSTWASAHPFLFAFGLLAAVLVVYEIANWAYAKAIEKGLISAHKDGRYTPRGAQKV